MTEIRDLRIMAGLTQFDLAKQSRVGRTWLSLVECGHIQPRPDEFEVVSRALFSAIRQRIVEFQAALEEKLPLTTSTK